MLQQNKDYSCDVEFVVDEGGGEIEKGIPGDSNWLTAVGPSPLGEPYKVGEKVVRLANPGLPGRVVKKHGSRDGGNLSYDVDYIDKSKEYKVGPATPINKITSKEYCLLIMHFLESYLVF